VAVYMRDSKVVDHLPDVHRRELKLRGAQLGDGGAAHRVLRHLLSSICVPKEDQIFGTWLPFLYCS